MNTTETNLNEQWQELLLQKPKTRIRDAAAQLGVSEAELLATKCGETVTRLEGDWTALLKEFPGLGRVMCLTRNEAIVHERHGRFEKLDFFHGMGQVVGPDIDLRLFMSHWHFGFAVQEATEHGLRNSFHFFDLDGSAVHKVYLQAGSDIGLYRSLVRKFESKDQGKAQAVSPLPTSTPDRPDCEVDVEGFRTGWDALKDTHEFFVHLRNFKVGRVQALRLAGPSRAFAVDIKTHRTVLKTAAASGTPIMVFVGNGGMIQIHTGTISNLKAMGPWFNVLDPDFNLHLNEEGVAEAWVVKKATKDGTVTSLELYDKTGTNLALFFGKRKPGEAELPAWRSIIDSLTPLT
jgi:putative hemin transport protein